VVGDVFDLDAAHQQPHAVKERGWRRAAGHEGGAAVISKRKRESHGFAAEESVRGIPNEKQRVRMPWFENSPPL
jgi:hypothetical protein